MPMTPEQRKEAMPHGGQRRAARRAKVGATYTHYVMQGVTQAKTPKGRRTLERTQRELAKEMGVPVHVAFEVADQATAA